MGQLLTDLRHATRMVVRAPGFAVLAISILATGIAATTVMFSLVEAALLRALPFEDPDRVVWMYNLRTERDRAPLSFPDVEDYRREASTLDGLALFTNWTANLTGHGSPERIEATRVSGNFFALLKLRPLRGRPIEDADEARETRVVVLTHGLWLRRFAGDERLVGRTILLNGLQYTVIGILPRGFLFPFRDAELAVPLIVHGDPRRADRGANFLRVLARLKSGVTIASAKTELDGIAHRLQALYPTENARKTGVSLYPLHAEIVRDYRDVLWRLLMSVGVLLAVACGNLTNLLLVRAVGRSTEFAVRLSLGASRGRVTRQLLSESAVLAAAGGVTGLGIAAIVLLAWRALGPTNFPQMAEVGINWKVAAAAAAVTAMTALVCGGLSAYLVSHRLADSLRTAARAMTSGRDHARLRRVFVALQLAASAVLLVGMGLTARGFARLEGISPGFAADQALSVQLSLPPRNYASREALIRFCDALQGRLTGVTTIKSAGVVSLLPLSGLLSTMDIAFPGRGAPPPDEVPQAHLRIASPGYLEAAGIRVLAGRSFTDDDDSQGRPVAIVSRTFASRHWPGQSAVGQQVQLVQGDPSPALEVIGVVNDVKHYTLDAPPTADLYVPVRQMPASQVPLLATRMFWVLRARGTTSGLADVVRDAVAKIDPDVATSSARTLAAVKASSLDASRVIVRVLEVFGDVALALCAMGVYAIAAFSSRTRNRELALRAALGARRRNLAALLLRTEVGPMALGIVVGLGAASLVASRLFGTPFGSSPDDFLTYLTAGMALIAIVAVALWRPIHAGSTTSPADVLRS